MWYQIDRFKVSVGNMGSLNHLVEQKFGISVRQLKILHRAIDARDKRDIFYVYRLAVETTNRFKGKGVTLYLKPSVEPKYVRWKGESPVIVGFGPAGMFAALYLARCGAKPIVLERGKPMEERVEDVNCFLKEKRLNPNSNVLFGEGGAGTFSDGKLVSNVKNPLIRFIFQEFYKHGAKEDILYDAMPHIGTDVLREVVVQIRKEIESLGGVFHFNTLFKNAVKKEDGLYIESTGTEEPIFTKHLLLGIGHSARDTIRHLYENMHIHMEQKAFSIGVRVEHSANWINKVQYGEYADLLPTAYYKLACHHNDRGIYTFCMCPGGVVMASQSEPNSIVTNGMSNSKRDACNSNSAVLVEIKPSDYDRGNVLDGIEFQQKYERLAYQIAENYQAPANLMYEFLHDRVAEEARSVKPSYPHGVCFCDLKRCLPDFVVEELRYGIGDFDRRMKGFYHPDAVVIGVETRSSCPVRILRNENLQTNIEGIYPIGEGAGYAGGITSSALDGLKTAIFIANRQNIRK